MKETIESPLISIIIPCYNHEAYVGDCIKSVIAQDYENIEILVCDDCSTDNSWEILNAQCSDMTRRFERVLLHRNDVNHGLTKTLNWLIDMSKGKYIKLLASDDAILPNCISTFANEFSKRVDADILICNGIVVQEEDRYPMSENSEKIYLSAPDLTKDTLFKNLYCNNYIFAPGVMVKSGIYKYLGKYDEHIQIEDWDYWLRAALDPEIGFGYIDSPLVYYRKNKGSMTSLAANKQLEKRRMRIHEAEMAILDKYKDKVEEELYAKNKIQRLEGEYVIAKRFNLKKLKKIIRKEFGNSKLWEYMGLKKKIKVMLYILFGL